MNAILVTGATGNVGRPLVTQLAAAGVEVRAVTRQPDTTRVPNGVKVVGTAAEGLPGASAVFLNSRALGDELEPLVRRARREGVTRLVALSAINADDDFSRQPSRFRGDRNKEVEQLAVDSGLEWVSLRPTVFITNFFGMWAPQIQAGNVVSGPYATASTAPIADRDISAVAAKALLTDELVGRKIPLTGPQAFTNTELVEAIGTVLARPLRYQEAPPDLVRQRFIDIGFSRRVRRCLHGASGGDGVQAALVTHDVEKILGRPAATFAEGVAAHRAAVRQLVRETSNVRTTSTGLAEADEQVHDDGPEARHPDRPGDGPDGAGQKNRQAAQHPDDAVRARRRPLRRGRLSRGRLGVQRTRGRRGDAVARTQIATRQDRRTGRGGITSRAADIRGQGAGGRWVRKTRGPRARRRSG